MKTVIVMRHAKSSWDDPDLDDHDRPLNPRGRKAAPKMARWLDKAGYRPDAVLSSSAVRARETLERMRAKSDALPEPTIEPALYHAEPERIVERLRGLPAGCGSVLVIGHEPGLSALVRRLDNGKASPEHASAFAHFPTAAAAILEFDLDDWSGLEPGTGRFVAFQTPRELG